MASDAAGAVQGNARAFGFPILQMRLNVLREMAKIGTVRIDGMVKAAEPVLEAVAVIQQHHVVLSDQLAPIRRADIDAGVAAVAARPV